jgi:PAS domain S-box-containing protein
MSAENQKTILLVEDEAIIASGEKITLEGYGYKVITARTGEEAIETVEKTPTIDLILMDINLGTGKMDGTIAAEIIQRKRDLPMVFLSSHTEPEIVEKTEKITSYGYVVKNTGSTVLDASIKMAFKLFEAKTKEKAEEEALRREKNFADNMVQTAQAIVLVLDTTGCIMSFNPYLERISGYPLREVQGKDWFSTFLPERNRDSTRELFRKAIADIQTRGNVDEIIAKDGHKIDIEWYDKTLKDEAGHVIGLLSIGQDITERKKAEEALRENEEKYRAIFENGSAAIAIIEPDTTISMVNEEYCKLSSHTKEEVIGVSWTEQIPAEDLERLKEFNRRRLMNPNDAPAKYEFSFIHKSGEIRYADISIGVLSNKKIIASFIDITERKRAEDKIKSLLREKELLLIEVHHRIKNNMSAMMSLLSLQIKDLKSSEAVAALLKARDRMRSMGVLYDKLYRSENLQEMSIKDYLSPLIDEIVGVFPNKDIVKIKKKIGDIVLGVNVLSPLGIIVNELLTNAMEHAFKGRKDGSINVSASVKDNHVTLIVEDNGAGIPESVDIANSRGLGLQLVGMLAAQIDGTIRIERGKGARLVLEFNV